MSRREDATNELVALAAMEQIIRARKAELKAELAVEMPRPGTREVAELAGRITGAVNMVKASSTWAIVDPAAFLRWVKAHHPTEVTEAVRESFAAKVMADLKSARPDPETGEIPCPDGIVPKSGAPYLRVTTTPDAVTAVLEVLGVQAVPLGLVVAGELE